MIELKKEQRELIHKYIEKYKEKLRQELEGEWRLEREKRIKYFRKIFNKKRINNLTEDDFAFIIKNLWASNIWTNKDYLVEKILSSNGIQQIRNELRELIYGSLPLNKRYDRFKNNIKGLGSSSITEILVFIDPKKYCLWNDKPKNVLPFLRIDNLLPDRVFKYPLNGKDYLKCNKVLKSIGKEIEKKGFKDIDFLDLDIFMWLLFLEEIKKFPKEKEKEAKIETKEKIFKIEIDKLSHWDVIGILLELGNLLDYDTYIADPSKKSGLLGIKLGEIAQLKEIPPFTYKKYVDTVKNVDVIWFKSEFPSMCFEVEHTSGVTLGLLRLYQIRSFTNTKFFIIAPSEIIEKFKNEISKDPFYEIKSRYNFKSYEELAKFFIEAKSYHKIKGDFLG